MKTYARVSDNTVVEIVQVPDDLSVNDCYTAEFVATLIDVTSLQTAPEQGWTYDGTTFAPYVAPPPSAAEVIARNTVVRDQLLTMAGLAIAPLQDAIELDEITPEESALLKLWKQFRVAVNRMDLTSAMATWPQAPV